MESKLAISRTFLRLGISFPFEIQCAPKFLDINEPYLCFKSTVFVQGICCMQEDGIFMKCKVRTEASMRCMICDEWINYEIKLKNIDHFEKNTQNCNNDFDFSNIVREEILLETPRYIECDSNCEKREEIKKYLKKEDHGCTPF